MPAPAPQMSLAAAEAAVNAITTMLNFKNNTASVIKIFTGLPPVNCEVGDTGTLLATLTLNDTAFNPATPVYTNPRGASASANPIESENDAPNGGNAGYFRAYYWDATQQWICVLQGDVGTANADMLLNTIDIVQGATVACPSWTLFLPNGGVPIGG